MKWWRVMGGGGVERGNESSVGYTLILGVGCGYGSMPHRNGSGSHFCHGVSAMSISQGHLGWSHSTECGQSHDQKQYGKFRQTCGYHRSGRVG